MFFELVESKCEGFVRIQDLPDDYYYYDAAQLKMIGQQTKRSISSEILFKSRSCNRFN